MKIGERIRNLRQLSNLTQEELAERANLTKGFISQIERDLTSISLDSLVQILEAMGRKYLRLLPGGIRGEDHLSGKGRVAIVTGASRGLGKAFSVAMAKEGARIMATDLISLGDVVNEIQALGGQVKALQADVTVEADTQKLAEETFKTFGRIDILVNNAGGFTKFSSLIEIAEEEWDRVLSVNLTSGFLCSREVLPHMDMSRRHQVIDRRQAGVKFYILEGSADSQGGDFMRGHLIDSFAQEENGSLLRFIKTA
jgi:transcriptional regulator with XRE-family HTH domain